jgi:hypothetical protein
MILVLTTQKNNIYEIAVSMVLKTRKIERKQISDIDNNTDVSKYDIVICCGENILDDENMIKVHSLLERFTGRIYALSADVTSTTYFKLFSHIFVNNQTDHDLASEKIGDKNVTIIPHILLSLKFSKSIKNYPKKRIGLCLDNNININDKINYVKQILPIQNYELHLFTFNNAIVNNISPDIIVYDQSDYIYAMCRNIDVNLCDSYYGEIYSKITQTKYSTTFDIETAKLIKETPNYDLVYDTIIKNSKMTAILKCNLINSVDQTFEECKIHLMKFLNLTEIEYDSILIRTGPLNVAPHTPVNFAIFLCYIISKQMNNPCVWGLIDDIEKSTFRLFDSINYIREYNNIPLTNVYYPKLNIFNRRTFINLDFIHQNDFAQMHRSGWSYVVDGISNIDAPKLLRRSNILLDTCVDRTFHWGLDTLKSLDIVPYKSPWVGFIHHTFDTTHSDYNCTNLFENDDFLESLKCCKCLITLSSTLADIVKTKYTVPVYFLDHPTEFVENMFTMAKFLRNPNKKIVQIGAWLRNSYGIYELPKNNLQKAILKGKEMDQYFPPDNFLEKMSEVLLSPWPRTNASTNYFCRPCRPCGPCRPSQDVNKYCEGVYKMLENNNNSVIIINKLNDEEYDNLLSENIVFLNLIDCSAVNTAIECIVRNTPLIVNRLPALEEMLGTSYPGFYDNYQEAASICNNFKIINNIYLYMDRLNKIRYSLDYFIDKLQDILLNLDNPNFVQEEREIFGQENLFNIYKSKFENLIRFLPARETGSF